MTLAGYLLIGLFLPLFPLSMVFNALFARITHPLARAGMLIAWPLIGLMLLKTLHIEIHGAVMAWALATAALYALRLLEIRELGTWTGFFATSAWAILWIPAGEQTSPLALLPSALAFSLPLALLVLVAMLLRRRLGGTYAGLSFGIATCLPRLSALLVITLLVVIATPPAPGFFNLLSILMLASPLITIGLLLVWLLWSWAASRMIHGFVVGPPPRDCQAEDISRGASWVLAVAFIVFVVAGLALGGGLS